jgi:hypothetical protein
MILYSEREETGRQLAILLNEQHLLDDIEMAHHFFLSSTIMILITLGPLTRLALLHSIYDTTIAFKRVSPLHATTINLRHIIPSLSSCIASRLKL